MKLNINPLSSDNPMSFKDAAVVALVVALVFTAAGFLEPWTYEAVAADPGAFLFELVKDIVKTFAATFITLAGLTEIVKRRESEGT